MWVPFVLLFYMGYAWLSFKNNTTSTTYIPIAMYFMGLIPLWILVSKYTQRLLFDAFLYDFLLIISTPMTLWYLGVLENFHWYNILGVIVVMLGMILVKI